MREKISSAINSKQVIKFYYDGGTRLVEPFCFGVHKSTNNEILRGYQVGGYSKSGEPFGWKIFRISEISGLLITNEHFSGAREDYNPDDTMMKIIYCHI